MKQKDQSRMHFCRGQTQGTAGGWESLRQCYWPRGVLVINCERPPHCSENPDRPRSLLQQH